MNDYRFADFLKSNIDGCDHFTWSDALYLPRWQIHAMPENPDVLEAIVRKAEKMELIRAVLQCPLEVTCWFRPLVYNELIGGAKRSSHLFGMAVDFVPKGMDANRARLLLQPHLKELNIRMEQLADANWVHTDINCTPAMDNISRYFKP